MASTEKLDEYIRLTSSGLSPEQARKALRVSDALFNSWLKDAKVRPRLEAALRMVAPPEVRDDEPSMSDAAKLVTSIGFYEFLTSKDFCDLEISPAVRAIVLASEARANEIQDDPMCVRLFGCDAAGLPRVKPRVVVVRSGGQCGKTSRLGAPKAVHAAVTVPLPNVRPGQWARSLIGAPTEDLAFAAIDYCRGIIFNSSVLRSMLTDELPEDADEEDVGQRGRIGLKRPDGKLVEIRVKAANSGGMGARSRSLVNALFDEFCFFRGSDSKVNDAEFYRAAVQRVVPDGQVWLPSTPWIEGMGKLEELVAKYHGNHRGALVALATTRLMFPGWDPDRIIESQMREEDPDNAAREIDNVPLTASESAFYSPAVIVAAEQRIIAPTAKMIMRGAGGDFAFVRNSSTLAIAEAYDDGTFAVTDLDEYKPRQGKALRPSIVCAKHARRLFNVETFAVMCDGHYRESVREHFGKRRAFCPVCRMLVEAPRQGEWRCEIAREDVDDLGEGCGHVWMPSDARTIGLVAGPESTHASDPFKRLRHAMNEGCVKLPAIARLSQQLKAVQGKPKEGPGQDYAIRQPEQRNSGPGATSAHGDLVSAVVLALWRVGLGRESPVKRKASFGKMAERRT
ncbi:MAG: hypothetical protein E6Q97_22005 [Desulfurellales bacterium]|nr:MAG: hypothetical protein E6Q97_22005 [Desulfurellales bacterium]